MLIKGYIEKNLEDLNFLYNSAKSQRKASYYSKLAVIELCGWIEESVDDIFKRTAKKKLKVKTNYDDFMSRLGRVSGFTYEGHIRQILIHLGGIKGVELFEKRLNKVGKLDVIKGILSNLKGSRDGFAHTFIKTHLTVTFQSPSSTLIQYKKIRPLIEEIEFVLVKVF